MPSGSRRGVKLACPASVDFAGVLASLVVFLEEFQELELSEPIELDLDVSELPLLMDMDHMRSIISVLARYENCFQKVALLRILPATGIQEMLVRGAVAVLPFSVPVQVQALGAQEVPDAPAHGQHS